MDKVKRSRSANFSEAESKLLMKLANQFKYIIENKKTDAATNKSKVKCWDMLTSLFNANTAGPKREPKVLRLKYDSTRKAIRRKTLGTGTCGTWKTTGNDEVLSSLNEEEEEETPIVLPCDRLLSVKGCDSNFAESHGVGVNPERIQRDVVPHEVTVEVDWPSYTPAMLMTPKHQFLEEAPSIGDASESLREEGNFIVATRTIKTEKEEEEDNEEKLGFNSCECDPLESVREEDNEEKFGSNRCEGGPLESVREMDSEEKLNYNRCEGGPLESVREKDSEEILNYNRCEVPPSTPLTPRSTLRKQLSSRRRRVLTRASRTPCFEELFKKKSKLLDLKMEILQCKLLSAQADLRIKLKIEEELMKKP